MPKLHHMKNDEHRAPIITNISGGYDWIESRPAFIYQGSGNRKDRFADISRPMFDRMAETKLTMI